MHNKRHFVHPTPKHPRKRVLILLGWRSPSLIQWFVQEARNREWHLETRHFFTECLPTRWRGDGLIVSDTDRRDEAELIRRLSGTCPTVGLGAHPAGITGRASVQQDDSEMGRLAAAHLLERGHRHLAWLNAYPSATGKARWEGFSEEVRRHGREPIRLEYRPSRPSADEWSRRRIWIEGQLRGLPRPAGLFALDDQLAAETIEMALECGRRVPEDLAVVGVGNLAMACETAHVPISSVAVPEERIAAEAAALLDALMRGESAPEKPIRVSPSGVVVRSSSERLMVTHPALVRAVAYLRIRPDRAPSMEQLADAAGVSRRTLYQLFDKHLGRTPGDLIRHLRIERTKMLLDDPTMAIAEVARSAGFGTPRTLNREFQRAEGMTPRAWRQQQNI